MSDEQSYPAKSNPSGNENKNSSQKLLEIFWKRNILHLNFEELLSWQGAMLWENKLVQSILCIKN